MEKIYNKWQLTELELKKIQPVRFTKEELLDFANYYHKQQLILHDVVKQSEQFNCYEMHAYSRFAGCGKQCKECADNEKNKAI